MCKTIEDFDDKLLELNPLLFELAKNIVSHTAFNKVLSLNIDFDEAADWNEIRLGCAYFAFMKLIGSEESPEELHTHFGPVDNKAVKCWETNQKFLMEEIGKSLAEKANRMLRECEALTGSLAQIKEALSGEKDNYIKKFGITDEKLTSIRKSLQSSYPRAY